METAAGGWTWASSHACLPAVPHPGFESAQAGAWLGPRPARSLRDRGKEDTEEVGRAGGLPAETQAVGRPPCGRTGRAPHNPRTPSQSPATCSLCHRASLRSQGQRPQGQASVPAGKTQAGQGWGGTWSQAGTRQRPGPLTRPCAALLLPAAAGDLSPLPGFDSRVDPVLLLVPSIPATEAHPAFLKANPQWCLSLWFSPRGS